MGATRHPEDGRTGGAGLDCAAFGRRVLSWTADALSARDSAAMGAHADICAACAALVEEERAFDRRVAAALESGGGREQLNALLARAGNRRSAPAARRKPLRFASAAAVFVAACGGAWFFCIPPFECAYVSAIEASAAPALVASAAGGDERGVADAGVWERAEALARRVSVPRSIGARALVRDAEACIVRELGWKFPAVRAVYGDGCADTVVVWCESGSQHPSFRREREIDGETWWADDGARATYAAFRCGGEICSVVAPGGDALDVARALRAASAR